MSLPAPTPTSTAVVTGASSGIGADIARELANRGYGVTLVARREDRLRSLAAELGNELSKELRSTVRVEVIVCDLADPVQRATLFDQVANLGLTVEILVNNAGVGTVGPVVDSTSAAEISQARLNVEAVIDLTTRAVQQMVPRGRGAILNVGSLSGFIPSPGQAGYAGTKAFTFTYTEGLRSELSGTGVTIATVCPGPVHTEFLSSAGADENSFGMPEFMYVPSRVVARIGIDALDADRGTVMAGWHIRVSAGLVRLLPARVVAGAMARSFPGSGWAEARRRAKAGRGKRTRR
jgi:short-subunit dehydrogenase